MKLRVERDALADAVAWAARALPSRPAVPVLAGLLLDADPAGILRLSSFDYEVSARVEVPAEVMDGGTALVSGRLLADISKSLPAKPVDVTTDGSKVSVTCGSGRFTLLTMPVEEYPSLPTMPEASGTVPGDDFAKAVSQVGIAASRDETLPILTGIRVEVEGDQLTLLATYRQQIAESDQSLAASEDAYHIAELRYRNGLNGYLNVLNAETAVLNARRTKIDLVAAQAVARVTLLLAVGGSFDPDSLNALNGAHS